MALGAAERSSAPAVRAQMLGVMRLAPYLLLGVWPVGFHAFFRRSCHACWRGVGHDHPARRADEKEKGLSFPALPTSKTGSAPGSHSSCCRCLVSPMPVFRSPERTSKRCSRRSRLASPWAYSSVSNSASWPLSLPEEDRHRQTSGGRHMAADLWRRAPMRHRLHHESFHRLAGL